MSRTAIRPLLAGLALLSATAPASRAAAARTAPSAQIMEALVPDARYGSAEWRYAADPAADWWDPGFDDGAWGTGLGGFGAGNAGGSIELTRWDTPVIHMRHTFSVKDPSRFESLILSVHHDDEVDIWLNGEPVFAETGALGDYLVLPLTDEAKALLREGVNVVAARCANSGGGPQYLDVGLFGTRTAPVTPLVGDARSQAGTWRYTTGEPAAEWSRAEFDDLSWGLGQGGFGSHEMYGGHVGSFWTDPGIWLRQSFQVDGRFPEYLLSFHHDDELDVYINGTHVQSRARRTTGYQDIVIPASRADVRTGVNVIAVHARNTGGGPQFIDVGLSGIGDPETPTAARAPRSPRASAKMPVLQARGGALDLSALVPAPGTGVVGRLEVRALDGSLRHALLAAPGGRLAVLPASLSAGAYRYRWTAGSSAREGLLLNLAR